MKKLILLMMSMVLFSCAQQEKRDTLVLFMEQERGVDPYSTRMIINKKFLRIDDGDGSTSFVLFDRVKDIVFSVNPDEKRVMAVHIKKPENGKEIEPPIKLMHSVKEMSAMKGAPKINGETAKHYQLITNNKVCYNVVAVKGLMPDVVTALTEFHQHMATDSKMMFSNIPADIHDACEMTLTTFKPAGKLAFGFPIREWGEREYVRSLVDYNVDYIADPKLFMLPEGYQNYTVKNLREGKVKFVD